MAEWTGTITTTAGKNLLAKMLAQGTPPFFTKVALGSGVPTEGTSEYDLTNLVTHELDLPLKSSTVVGDGTAKIEFQLTNAYVTTGFQVKEIGVFANDPDLGEILFQYDNCGDKYDYMPAGSSINLIDRFVNIIIGIQDTQQITLNIDTSLLFATEQDFQNHINSTNPHTNFLTKVTPVTTIQNVWGYNTDDKQLTPITFPNLQSQVLGGDANTIPLLDSRIRQVDTEVSNIYIQLCAQNDCPSSNLLLAEDFKSPDKIDLFNVNVTSVVAGDNSIDVERLSDFIEGNWYWITDGVNSEYIQIDACIQNDTTLRILAHTDTNPNLQKVYSVDLCKIYRTTAQIDSDEGIAYGSGQKVGGTWNPSLLWSGLEGSAPVNDGLITTLDNADEFTLTNGITFTADGYITVIPYQAVGIALISEGGGAGTWDNYEGTAE